MVNKISDIDRPKISVVIPTHNREKLIIPCIESVLNQTYPVDEILIIDDHSSDKTISLINNLDNSKIRVKNSTKNGAQAARNIGIKLAKSDWIAFTDSDDIWLPNKIEKQVEELSDINFDQWVVIHGNCYKYNLDSKIKELWQIETVDGENVYQNLLTKPGPLFPSILTSKKALEHIRFLDEDAPSYHEWDTVIRLSKYCRFIHIVDPLFVYNIHQESISKNSNISIAGYQYVINKHKEEILHLCGKEVVNNHIIINSAMAMNNKMYSIGRELLKQIPGNNLKKSILKLLSFVRLKPKHLTYLLKNNREYIK